MAHSKSIDFLENGQFVGFVGLEFDPGGINVEQPHARIVSQTYNLAAGYWLIDSEFEVLNDDESLRVGIFCEKGNEQHVIGTSLNQTMKMIEIIGGLTRFEFQFCGFPRRLKVKKLRFLPLDVRTILPFVASRLVAKFARWFALTKQVTQPADFKSPVLSTQGLRRLNKEWFRVNDDLSVFVPEDQHLDARAITTVIRHFDANPDHRAVFGDTSFRGKVWPTPSWDPLLATDTNFIEGAVFLKGGEDKHYQGTGKQGLTLIAQQLGNEAIGRIPLPLSTTDRPRVVEKKRTPIPQRDEWPSVTIIIPTKSRLDLLHACLKGLATETDYSGSLDIVVVDNGAKDEELSPIIATFEKQLSITRLHRPAPFNFSWLINQGASVARGEVILMMNDDVSPLLPCWLNRMIHQAMQPSVGAVGAQLLGADGLIQHAGVALGIAGLCGHMWRGLSSDEASQFPSIHTTSRRSAVTGACLAVRRELFLANGGLDENLFPVTLNDIDFCLRLNHAGYQTVYCGDAVLRHEESSSRGSDKTGTKVIRRAGEVQAFQNKWRAYEIEDPCFSPAFNRFSENGL
jgi:GT2 family glycosyltransferase